MEVDGCIINDMDTPTTSESYQPAPNPVPPPVTPPAPAMPEPKPSSSHRALWIALVAVIVLAGGAYAWLWLNPGTQTAQTTPSPSSTVSITASPTPDATAGWKTGTDASASYSFRYPEALSTQYIHVQTWPPAIVATTAAFSCAQSATTSQKTINNRIYCVSATSGGAAGTIFTDYLYVTAQGTKLLEMSFSLGYPQCANYDAAGMAACQQERTAFNVDALADQILSTFKFTP